MKVLDFGLAKMVEPGGASGSAGLSMSPTLSVHATFAGVILGTAAYMSPEQARGRPVDKRTDIWAFGCVLFEMIAGRQTFDAGDTVSDAVAAILKTEPDWSALPADTPLRVRALLRRCLEKDPSRRLRDIGDARLELDDAIADPLPPAPVATAKRPSTSARLAWSIASVLGLALAGVGVTYVLMPRAAPAVVRFQILAPEGRFDTNIGNNGLNSGTDFAGRPKAGVCADAEAANLDSTDRFAHRDAARRNATARRRTCSGRRTAATWDSSRRAS